MQPAVSALVLLGFSFHARYARGLIREIKLAELLSEKMRAKSQRGIVLRSRMLHAKVCYSVFKSNGLVDLRSEIMINVAVETHRLGADSFVVEHSRLEWTNCPPIIRMDAGHVKILHLLEEPID